MPEIFCLHKFQRFLVDWSSTFFLSKETLKRPFLLSYFFSLSFFKSEDAFVSKEEEEKKRKRVFWRFFVETTTRKTPLQDWIYSRLGRKGTREKERERKVRECLSE